MPSPTARSPRAAPASVPPSSSATPSAPSVAAAAASAGPDSGDFSAPAPTPTTLNPPSTAVEPAVKTVNVMAPLFIGNPDDPTADTTAQWQQFKSALVRAKELGAYGVATDVWWGVVQKDEGNFDWSYYRKMADTIAEVGLKWVPVLSFHQCGGNVGDDVNIPLPSWVGPRLQHLAPEAGADAPFYKSEQGNVNRESVSVWASEAAMPLYEQVMRSFLENFGDRRELISEVTLSLGPAGELRYPSYNVPDQNAGYPTRGSLQTYSALALESFRRAMLDKYGSLEAISQAWNTPEPLQSEADLLPPSDPSLFFGTGAHFAQYGQDYFDWAGDSLNGHMIRTLGKADEVFNPPGSPLRGVDLGVKLPGVHWRVLSDRAAELAAGLIRTSDASLWNDDTAGHGYGKVVGKLSEVANQLPHRPNVVLHFTCLEMEDGEGGPQVASAAKSLVDWVGATATLAGLRVKGENALAGTLQNPEAWDNMADALAEGYDGVTVLRVTDVVNSPVASQKFQELAERFDGD